MITAIVTSDNHLGVYYARLRPDRLETRRRHLQAGFKRAVDAALARRVDLFLHAGDLFDRPDPRNAERRFVAEQFQRLREADIPIFAIAGNHDSPRSYGYDGGVVPQEEMNALGAVRLFRETVTWDAETLLVRGQRVCVRGLSSDFNRPTEECALQDAAPHAERGGDIDLTLLHYGVEGWGDFPLEPSLTLANLDRLNADAVCVGHLHTPNRKRMPGGALLLNPGATEHIRFGEERLDCGCWLLHCEPGRVEAEYLRFQTQPMRTLEIDLSELTEMTVQAEDEGDTPEVALSLKERLLERIGAASHPDTMLRARFKGRLPRKRLPELDVAAIQAHGSDRCFHFQLETADLTLYDELEGWHLDIGFSFDVREELQKAMQGLLPNYADDDTQREVLLAAGRELDTAYERLTGGAR